MAGDGTAYAEVRVALNTKPRIAMAGFDINPTVYGRPEWTYDESSGQWIIGGYFGIGAKFSQDIPPAPLPPIPLPPLFGIPTYLKGQIKGDFAGRLGVGAWDGNSPVPNGQVDFEGIGYLVVGAGVNNVAAVEGYFGAGPKIVLQFPVEPSLKQLGVKFKGGVRIVFFMFNLDWPLLDYSWWLVGAPEGESLAIQRAIAAQLNNPRASSFHLAPRDYLATPKSYAVFAAAPSEWLRAMSSDGVRAAASTLNTMQANVYPYSEPDISANGSNRLMVWIWDNPERSAENRTELVWSKWSDGAWSNPTSVWNEATADFSPSVRVLSDGAALAVWENERASLTNGATLDDVFAGLEVAAGVYNTASETWTSTNLTDNLTIDHSPQFSAASNGHALLTWVSNASNSPNGSVSAPNAIHSRLWNGATWQDSGTISTNVRMLLWSTVAFDGTNGVFLAALDGDDDQTTVEDQELFGAIFTGGVWSALSQWTTNAVQDTKPQAAYDSDGNILVAWYQGSNIVMRAGDLNLASATKVGRSAALLRPRIFALSPALLARFQWFGRTWPKTVPAPILSCSTTTRPWASGASRSAC